MFSLFAELSSLKKQKQKKPKLAKPKKPQLSSFSERGIHFQILGNLFGSELYVVL